MAMVSASLCGLFVYISLGAALVWGEPLGAAESVGVDALTKAPFEEVVTPDSAASLPMGGMSADEKERRIKECETRHDQCYDQCTRFYATSKSKKVRDKLEPCYAQCGRDVADCMERIP